MIRRYDSLVRVAVMVNGDYRQRYLSLKDATSRAERERILRQARLLEARWLADQRRAGEIRRHRGKPTARAAWPHATGVRGITLQLAERRRGGKRWLAPRFELTGAGLAVCIGIKTRGLGAAWTRAVRTLAAAHGIRDCSHWLRRQPPAAQLRALRRRGQS